MMTTTRARGRARAKERARERARASSSAAGLLGFTTCFTKWWAEEPLRDVTRALRYDDYDEPKAGLDL